MAFGRRKSDLEEGVNVARMQNFRRNRAREALKKRGLAGILAFNTENIRYLTIGPSDRMKGGGSRYALFPVEKPAIIFDCGMTQGIYQQENPDIDIRSTIPAIEMFEMGLIFNPSALAMQRKKFVDQIVSALREKGILKEKIGVDQGLSGDVLELFKKAGVNLSLEGLAAMMEARSIKGPDEVECLRVAASMVEACFAELKHAIKPGVTEDDLMGLIFNTALRLGAETLEAHVEVGRHTWPNFTHHSDVLVRPGDLIYLDIYGLSFLGYKTCYYRTFSCGEPTKAQRDCHKRVVNWLRSACEALKPGVTTKEIVSLWPKAPEFGRPSEDAAILMQWGHGIGLGLNDPPFMSRIWSLEYPEEIKAGMTLALETIDSTGEITYEYPSGQGVRVEDMVHVTEKGVEYLSRWPVDDITACEI